MDRTGRLSPPSLVGSLLSTALPLLQALPGQQTPDGVPSFKLVLVGDGGTGEARRAR